MSYIPLTRGEEKLMLFLWKQGKPLSVSEIMELWEDKSWKKNYTRDVLRSLEEKGAVEFCGLQRSAKNYARRFRPVMTKEDYFAEYAKHNGVSVKEMLNAEAAAMVKRGKKQEMDKLIRELEGMIEEYRQREDGDE